MKRNLGIAIGLLIIGILGIVALFGYQEAQRPYKNYQEEMGLFASQFGLIIIVTIVFSCVLLFDIKRNPKSLHLWVYILIVVSAIYLYFWDSSANHVGWFTGAITISLPVLIGVTGRYLGNSRRSKTINRLWNKTKASASPLFVAPFDDPCWYWLTLAGGVASDWRLCSLRVWPSYVAIRQKPELPFLHPIFTFNRDNIRWLGSIQTYSKTESEMWFDLEIDGLWYTLCVRSKKSVLKHFMQFLDPILPVISWTNDHRRYPNVRCGPVAAAPVVAAESAWLLAGEPLQLYLTPLYLVLLNETFVQQAIPLAEVKGLEVLAAANLPDQQIVRFGQGDKTLAFAVQDQDFVHTLKARL